MNLVRDELTSCGWGVPIHDELYLISEVSIASLDLYNDLVTVTKEVGSTKRLDQQLKGMTVGAENSELKMMEALQLVNSNRKERTHTHDGRGP